MKALQASRSAHLVVDHCPPSDGAPKSARCSYVGLHRISVSSTSPRCRREEPRGWVSHGAGADRSSYHSQPAGARSPARRDLHPQPIISSQKADRARPSYQTRPRHSVGCVGTFVKSVPKQLRSRERVTALLLHALPLELTDCPTLKDSPALAGRCSASRQTTRGSGVLGPSRVC
jgi:hypothetical protein